MDLRERKNAVVSEEHWYYRSKLIPVLRAFESFAEEVAGEVEGPLSVVDFGAGSGYFGRSVEARFPELVERVFLVDVEYSEEELGSVAGTKQVRVRSLPLIEGPVFVMVMDVLEHLEEDGVVLRSVVDSAQAGSRFLITVPAFKSLWSRHDEVLGHFRRYRARELVLLSQSSGLETIRYRYLFGLIFPFVFVLRRLRRGSRSERSDLAPASPMVNWTLEQLCSFEMRWGGFNRWVGVTAMVEALKQHSHEPKA